jgi:hypothetical protein
MKAFGKFKSTIKNNVVSMNKISSPLFKSNNFLKLSCKFVSGNPQSKVNRENRELDKIEKFWDGVDKQVSEKTNIVKEVEDKYHVESFLLGKDISTEKTENKALDASLDEKLVEVYYVPLTKDDGEILNNFSSNTQESIIKGGRVVLYNEIINYNRSQPIEKHLTLSPPFEPLTNDEIFTLQFEFDELYKNEKLFNYVLQNGRPMYNELKKIRDEKIKKVQEYKKKLNYVDHYGEAMSSVPFNTKIAVEFQKYEDPHYVKLFLKNFDEEKCTSELKNVYMNFYKELNESIKNKGKSDKSNQVGVEKIKNQIEPCLYDRINAFIDYVKLNNLKFDIEKGNLPQDQEKSYIFEKLFFKGVHVDRYQNDEPNDYILIDSHEDMGIRYYLHKYLYGDSQKYHQKKDALTTSFEFNTDEYHNSKNFFVKERNRKIVLRVYLFIKHNEKVTLKSGNSNLIEYSPDYTYNHLAVFENELIQPNHSFLISNNFESWLLKQKLDHKNWKLVDVDNFMKGNPFFLKKSSFAESIDTIFSDDIYTFKALESKFPDVKNPENLTLKVGDKDKKAKKTEKPEKGGKGEKSKKGKEDSKAQSQTDTQSLINSLQFNYKVTKIPRPFDDTLQELKPLIDSYNKEYKNMIEQEKKKHADALEAQSKRQAEIKRGLDVR